MNTTYAITIRGIRDTNICGAVYAHCTQERRTPAELAADLGLSESMLAALRGMARNGLIRPGVRTRKALVARGLLGEATDGMVRWADCSQMTELGSAILAETFGRELGELSTREFGDATDRRPWAASLLDACPAQSRYTRCPRRNASPNGGRLTPECDEVCSSEAAQ